MNEETLIAGLLDTYSAKHGWLAAALTWIGTARVGFKLVSGKLEEAIAAFVEFSVSTKDADAVDRINASRTYRLLAFLADYIASVKLPLQARSGQTVNIPKP
jgi:hypothetical protein